MNQDNESEISSRPSSFVLLSSVTPTWRHWRNVFLKTLVFIAFLVFLYVHFADPIRFVTADLGRHLKNGELILAGQSKVFTSNFYSYTDPDHPFINHHWGTGVLFYLVYKAMGFTGLSFFYIGVLLAGFCVYFLLACRVSNFTYAFFFSVLALPIFTDRLEIRPEGITTLLTGLYLYLLFMHRSGRLSFGWTALLLAVLQVIWVNTHILFFIGGYLVFVFLLDAWLGQKDKAMTRRMLIIVGVTAAVSLINPAGLKGALVPLMIFQEYGYRLAENQTVFFMQKRFGHDPKYFYFEFLAVVSLIGLVGCCMIKRWRNCLAEILVLVFFLVLGFKTVRSMASFAFVFIPLMAMFVWSSLQTHVKIRRTMGIVLGSASVLLLVHGAVVPQSMFSPLGRLESFVRLNGGTPRDVNLSYMLNHPQVITGLVPGINAAADFVKRHEIQGPMFNNYDIGGYLIFHLYPQVKVFVDNRPEVYRTSFFKDDYIPMQENNDVWQRIDKQYGFNLIFFYRHDLTPWGQNFLINRIDDPQWAPVYVDMFNIIFLKRNESNSALIKRFELPRSMFSVTR